MESMIKRAVEAIKKDIGWEPEETTFYAQTAWGEVRISFEDMARAVIEAMREPNEGMRRQGFLANCKVQACVDYEENGGCCYCGQGFDQRDGCGHAAVAAYQAMIDAALQEGENES